MPFKKKCQDCNSVWVRVNLKGKAFKAVVEAQNNLINKTGLSKKVLGKNRVIQLMLCNSKPMNIERIEGNGKEFLIT